MSDFRLDTEAPEINLNYLARIRYARDERGIGFVPLFLPILKGFWSKRLIPWECLFMEVYAPDRDAETFIGADWLTRFMAELGIAWVRFAEDKIGMAALLQGYGLPIPETQALYHAWREIAGTEPLRSRDGIVDFLRNRARYPLFCKPVGSQLSLGTASIASRDPDTDQLTFAGGETATVDGFVDQILGMGELAGKDRTLLDPEAGYLFQSRLTPHPELERFLGRPVIATVRMVVVLDRDGPHLHRAVWKVIGKNNSADNVWRPGNFAAGLDPETGRIVHATTVKSDRLWPVTEHRGTGVKTEGFQFPEWPAMVAMAKRAAASVPECPIQGWDVALTDQGPVLIELQAGGGSPLLSQMGFKVGLYEGRYRDVVERARANLKAHKRAQKAALSRHRGQQFQQLLR